MKDTTEAHDFMPVVMTWAFILGHNITRNPKLLRSFFHNVLSIDMQSDMLLHLGLLGVFFFQRYMGVFQRNQPQLVNRLKGRKGGRDWGRRKTKI